MKKLKTALLDTNVWVSFFLEADDLHYQSKRLISKLLKQNYKIYIPTVIILEIVNVLGKNKYDKSAVINLDFFNEKFREYEKIEFQFSELKEISLHFYGKTSLKSQDYIIFLHCAKLKPDIFYSYDIKLKEATNFHLNL